MASTQHRASERTRPDSAPIRAVRTRPDRVVFMADGEPDAWIASDLLVDLAD